MLIKKLMKQKKYIESILDEKINTASFGVDTGSVIIDAVINNKIAFCTKNKIAMKCMIDTRLGELNDVDISILCQICWIMRLLVVTAVIHRRLN